ncbi:Pr6Pr family membrane protein [Parasphingopyxis marina]|uniref:Pr6Pr family membrane protein n=1 Tax=Parasphingopyxis marina TaxID=2761622 RepID=A0A842HWP9_9SPHN|nr:Pr6Pr family membrane protein [Parasphingopyxis marina]MBC2776370.1 Pr6Pr family membrane protein [Parasphingopyxis marina]
MQPMLARSTAFVTALLIWAALGIQLAILIRQFADQDLGLAAAVWRFSGFFTILTNMAVAIVASAMALRPESRLAGPRLRLAVAVSIALVGIVYSLALRSVWNPQGWQAVVDHALHDASPLLFLLAWALFPHGRLGWRDAIWGIVFPLAYVCYAMARGAADGWYAYWFLDPAALPAGDFVRNIALLLAGFAAASLLLIAIDRIFAKRVAAI